MADFWNKIEETQQNLSNSLNKAVEEPAVSESEPIFEEQQAQEDAEAAKKDIEISYYEANNYAESIANTDSHEEEDVKKREISLYMHLRASAKKIYETLTGVLNNKEAEESDEAKETEETEETEESPDDKQASENSDEDEAEEQSIALLKSTKSSAKESSAEASFEKGKSKAGLSSGLSGKIKSALKDDNDKPGKTEKTDTAGKTENSESDTNSKSATSKSSDSGSLSKASKNFSKGVDIAKNVINNDTNESDISSGNSSYSNNDYNNNNNEDNNNNNNQASIQIKLTTVISNIKNYINQIGKIADVFKTSGITTSAELESIVRAVNSGVVTDTNIEKIDVTSDSLGSLRDSERQLELGIESNTEALRSVRNGSNSAIKAANENYTDSVNAFYNALDVSGNPVVVNLQNQILQINDCITQQNAQLMQYDEQLSNIKNNISQQDNVISKLSGAISGYSDQISDLQEILQGVDGDGAAEIESSIAELKNIRKNLENQQNQAKRNRENTVSQQEQLNSEKNKTLESIRESGHNKSEAEIQLNHLEDTIISQARSVMVKNLEILENLKSNLVKQLEAEISNAKNKLSGVQSNISDIANTLAEESDPKAETEIDKNETILKATGNSDNRPQKPENKPETTFSDSQSTPVEDFIENSDYANLYQIVSQTNESDAKTMSGGINEAEYVQDKISQMDANLIENQMKAISYEIQLGEIDMYLQGLTNEYADLKSYDLSSLDKSKAEEIRAKTNQIEAKITELLQQQESIQRQLDFENKKNTSYIREKNIFGKEYDDTLYYIQEAYLEAIDNLESNQ